MFHLQIKEFLNSVCEQIKYKPARESISEELKNHIEELKENYVNQGFEEEKAEIKAVEQMGDSIEIGKKLNKIHKPKFDWKLVLIVILLLFFGFLISYIRTTSVLLSENEIDYMLQYTIALIIGILLSIGVYFLNYKKIIKYSNYIYGLATIIIIYTLLNGIKVNGIPYFGIGNIFVSASVITIPLYIIAFVGFLTENKKESEIEKFFQKHAFKFNIKLFKIISLSILSLILLTMIPSIASSFILGMIYLILGTVKILRTEKNKKKKILILWGTIIILGVFFVIIYIGREPYILDRIVTTFSPQNDPEGRRMAWNK